MTVKDLAKVLGCTDRWARVHALRWLEMQRNPRVPRVRVVHTGRRGRPAYHVDRVSFDAWRSRSLGGVEALAA